MKTGRLPWLLLFAVVAAGCGGQRTEQLARPRSSSPTASGQVAWVKSYAEAVTESEQTGRPLLVDVGTDWCAGCKRLDETVWPEPSVVAASRKFVAVRVDGDKETETTRQLKVDKYPTVLFLTSDGKEIERVLGSVPPKKMLSAMDRAAQGGSSR